MYLNILTNFRNAALSDSSKSKREKLITCTSVWDTVKIWWKNKFQVSQHLTLKAPSMTKVVFVASVDQDKIT